MWPAQGGCWRAGRSQGGRQPLAANTCAPPLPRASSPPQGFTIFIGNWAGDDDGELREAMAQHGRLVRCFIMRNPAGQSKHYAYAGARAGRGRGGQGKGAVGTGQGGGRTGGRACAAGRWKGQEGGGAVGDVGALTTALNMRHTLPPYPLTPPPACPLVPLRAEYESEAEMNAAMRGLDTRHREEQQKNQRCGH